MIQAHKELTKPMLGAGDDAVLVGRDGRMFYLGEDAVRQSAGLVLRDQRVADTVALIKAMRDELRSRGVGFIVAPPPNAATVYQDDLPGWAQNGGKRTEYDMLLGGLAAEGVKAVDLRPVMKKASAEGPAYYRHDSHWTARGALAAYNAIVEADGRPDWRIDPGAALTPLSERKGGDLARLLGVQDSVTEEVEEFDSAAGIEGVDDDRSLWRLCPDTRRAGSDDHDFRRLVYCRVFPAIAAATRGTDDLDLRSPLWLRLEADR